MRILLFAPNPHGGILADGLARAGHHVRLVSTSLVPGSSDPSAADGTPTEKTETLEREILTCDLTVLVVTDEAPAEDCVILRRDDISAVVCFARGQHAPDPSLVDPIASRATAVITPDPAVAAAVDDVCAGPVILGPVVDPEEPGQLDAAIAILVETACDHARIRPILGALRGSVSHIAVWQGDRSVLDIQEHWEPLRLFGTALASSRDNPSHDQDK